MSALALSESDLTLILQSFGVVMSRTQKELQESPVSPWKTSSPIVRIILSLAVFRIIHIKASDSELSLLLFVFVHNSALLNKAHNS
jgi:hypothetical protein